MSKKRTVLKLKKEYEGKILKITVPKMGEMTFDTRVVSQSNYSQYVSLGFGHCFDEIEQVDAAPNIVDALREAMSNPVKKEVEDEFEDDDDDNGLEELGDEDFEDESEDESDDNESESDELKVSGAANNDFEGMEWGALKNLAKERGMKIEGRTKKAAVIEFLKVQ